MHWTPRREKFRAVLEGNKCIHPGSVYDAMSARCAEDIGFEVGMFAGSTASMAVLGSPDLIVLTLTEFAGQAYRINRAGNLPLLVDADHGYGNALNVKRTIEELETAGVAGLTIEDTDLPRPYGTTKPQLISIDEGVGKMKAALAGRQDKSLAIAGRTSAVGINGVEDGIARAKAYEKAGVDAMFFAGISSKADMEAIAAEVKIPIYLGSTPPEINDLAYLGTQGVRIALQGHAPIHAAVQAVHDTLKALRDGTQPADITNVVTGDLKEQILRGGDHKQWLKNFLASG
jgi:carboxyvinyl-carboxyphosphonate phosphorylmutase